MRLKLKSGNNLFLYSILGMTNVLILPHPGTAAEEEGLVEEIVVISQSLEDTIPQDLARYGNRLEIVTAEQIQQSGFIDVSQTLQMLVPGLHVAPKNGPFDYFDASLQGSRSQEILWLIDGVRITNRLYNGTSPLDTVPVHMIERIEVLKGGQGIFYGTQSVGGVVNIVTKNFSEQSDGAVGSGVNSNDGYNLNGYYRTAFGQHQIVLFGSRDDADGYQPYRNEDIQPSSTDRERSYRVDTAGFKYAWNFSPASRLSLQYQFTDNELDFARPYLNNKTVNAREEEILSFKYDLQVNDSLDLFIKAYRHNWDTEYTRIYNELDESGNLTGNTVVINDRSYWGYEDYGFNAMARLDLGVGIETLFGFDQQNFSGQDDVWRIGDQEEEVNAPFFQIRTTDELLPDTHLALGVRNNRASSSEDSTVWNLTGRYELNDYLYLQGNVGTSFRLPDAEALFLNEYYDLDNDGVPDGGWFSIGNPDLEPEESRNLNLAIGGSLQRMQFELTYFARDITNYIESYVPVEIAGVEGESFANTSDEVEMRGFELIASVALGDDWSFHFSHTDTDARLNGSGPQLTGIPERESKLRLDYRPSGRSFGVSLSSNLVGRINARRGSKRGDYAVSDLSAFFNLGDNQQHRISLRLENLTDEEYATRIDRGTLDSTGASYLFENLGMSRTLHVSYTYQF
ncbi:MAG: TonB-dependent receptor [Planctomycetaceae bacterium]|nr:TonB-dependent receptor [Planctomycetaceae bacterium]